MVQGQADPGLESRLSPTHGVGGTIPPLSEPGGPSERFAETRGGCVCQGLGHLGGVPQACSWHSTNGSSSSGNQRPRTGPGGQLGLLCSWGVKTGFRAGPSELPFSRAVVQSTTRQLCIAPAFPSVGGHFPQVSPLPRELLCILQNPPPMAPPFLASLITESASYLLKFLLDCESWWGGSVPSALV